MDLLHLLHLLHLLLASTALRCSAVDIVTVVDFCGQTIQGDGMIVNSHQESLKYYFVDIGIDCHLTMQASSPKDKSSRGSVHLKPRQELTSGETSGDLCLAGPYIQFYDGPDKDSPTLGPPLCGKSPPRPVLSTGKYLTLRLVTRGTQPRVDFVGDFTSFRLGFNQSECSSDPYFTCRNGKCIPVSLVCDDKGLDNCGDGSDLEENLTTGCKAGQLLSPEPRLPVATPPPSFVSPTTVPTVTQMNCSIPDSTPSHEPIADMTPSLFLLILCSILGVVVGGVLFWCCWSPSWFLWHIGICRFMPCCNSACASCQFCQFCAHNCTHNKEHRMAKVSPHTPVNITLMGTSTTNSTEENITAVAV